MLTSTEKSVKFDKFPEDIAERVKVVMAKCGEAIALLDKPPTPKSPLVINSHVREEILYIWTGLMIFGERSPIKFGNNAIVIPYIGFSPEAEIGIFGCFGWGFSKNSLYETVFKHHLTEEMLRIPKFADEKKDSGQEKPIIERKDLETEKLEQKSSKVSISSIPEIHKSCRNMFTKDMANIFLSELGEKELAKLLLKAIEKKDCRLILKYTDRIEDLKNISFLTIFTALSKNPIYIEKLKKKGALFYLKDLIEITQECIEKNEAVASLNEKKQAKFLFWGWQLLMKEMRIGLLDKSSTISEEIIELSLEYLKKESICNGLSYKSNELWTHYRGEGKISIYNNWLNESLPKHIVNYLNETVGTFLLSMANSITESTLPISILIREEALFLLAKDFKEKKAENEEEELRNLLINSMIKDLETLNIEYIEAIHDEFRGIIKNDYHNRAPLKTLPVYEKSISNIIEKWQAGLLTKNMEQEIDNLLLPLLKGIKLESQRIYLLEKRAIDRIIIAYKKSPEVNPGLGKVISCFIADELLTTFSCNNTVISSSILNEIEQYATRKLASDWHNKENTEMLDELQQLLWNSWHLSMSKLEKIAHPYIALLEENAELKQRVKRLEEHAKGISSEITPSLSTSRAVLFLSASKVQDSKKQVTTEKPAKCIDFRAP